MVTMTDRLLSPIYSSLLGTFTRKEGELHNGRPLWENPSRHYLYYYGATWRIGPDFSSAGIRSSSRTGDAFCMLDLIDATGTKLILTICPSFSADCVCARARYDGPNLTPSTLGKPPKLSLRTPSWF